LELESVTAIDVHVHAERNQNQLQDPVTGEILAAAARYFGGHPSQLTAQEVADHYRERNMLAVIFNVDDEAGMGRRRLGNQEILDVARANPDVLIPFASIDQLLIKDDVRPLVLKQNAIRLLKLDRVETGPDDDR
jgi:uncharacterized protein